MARMGRGRARFARISLSGVPARFARVSLTGMSSTMIAALTGLVGFLAGVLGTAVAVRQRRLRQVPSHTGEQSSEPPLDLETPSEPAAAVDWNAVTLLGRALRGPLARLRRTEACPPEALEEVERVAWQARMLVSRPRPMQAKPVAPIALLQEAAEQVELLRLGKVPASWSLRNRQPIHADPERTRSAFRELLTTAAETAGESGRVGIRILSHNEAGYPVRVEIEIGRRGSEPDPLALLVAGKLLEAQGARLEWEGHVIRVSLRSAPSEP